MSTSQHPNTTDKPAKIPTRTRVVQLIFLALAVGATLVLAYWQLSRWNTTSSFQNLGYALQWPAFGLFFIWAYRKYMEYERERLSGNSEAAFEAKDDVMTEIPDEFLPTNPDGSRKVQRVDETQSTDSGTNA
ncbi:hypothetical protein QP167_10020 [Corynebacterium amycolatum]|uniref:hypothetical protein n=1 Tax=Corynebacterium TaxID=1716 RepID=UPI000665EE6F|nr:MULTISPECIES: hypothetical protein [Corynebacterium]ASE57561.1 hypothetical protein CEQ06_11720 [Corynebacterium jeikeium]MBC6768325.1 hypothetical protein [Corynebacterium sp. LK15]MBC6792697.1 hypothetical protein [Corynebacterium sp. LK26]MBC6806727.1 hypothetical protein [Corynebacterium sp. LK30]KAA9244624.1 hypothetical protein F6I30_08495 [Corynebacterium amycolatum]